MSVACRHNLKITTLHPNFSSSIETVLAFEFQLTALWETALQTSITSLKKLSLNREIRMKDIYQHIGSTYGFISHFAFLFFL